MVTLPNDKRLSGCIVLERGEGFLADQIVLHMRILALYKGCKPLKWTHAETLVWKDRKLMTFGARAGGTEISKVGSYYGKHEIALLVPVVPFDNTDNAMLWDFYDVMKDKPYQKGNFLAWIGYLKSGLWLGGKGSERNYCYELAARAARATSRWHKPETGMVSVYDLAENYNYRLVESLEDL